MAATLKHPKSSTSSLELQGMGLTLVLHRLQGPPTAKWPLPRVGSPAGGRPSSNVVPAPPRRGKASPPPQLTETVDTAAGPGAWPDLEESG